MNPSFSTGRRKVRDRRRGRPALERLEDRQLLSVVAAGSQFHADTNTAGNESTPAVAMDANGDYVVVWAEDSPNAYTTKIEAQLYHANGTPNGGEFTVNQSPTPTNTTRYQPAVAMDANGDFTVAWSLEPPQQPASGYYYDIEAQRFNAAAQPQGSELQVNAVQTQTPTELTNPTVAMDGGNFVVGWIHGAGNSATVHAQLYSYSGTTNTKSGSEFNVSPATVSIHPSVAMDSSGDFVFVWDTFNGTSDAVLGRVYNAAGAAQGAGPFAVDSGASVFNPRVAMNAAGRFVVGFENQTIVNSSSSYEDVFAQQFQLTGSEASLSVTALSSGVELNADGGSDAQTFPSVGIDGQGFATVTWLSESPSNGADEGIFARRLNPDGSFIEAAPFRVAPPATGETAALIDVGVAVSATGNAAFVFQTAGVSSDPGQGVFGQLYDYVNNAPTIASIANQKIAENGSIAVPLSGIAAGGNEEQTLGVSASSNNTSLIVPTITYTSPSSTGTLNLTPVAGMFGTATITVTVTDSGGTSNGGVNATSVQFTLTVTGAPTANAQSVAVAFNTAKAITLTGSDPNSPPQSLTYSVATTPAHGTLSGTAPNLTYTPSAGYHGPDSFTFTVNNGSNTSAPATVTLNVAAGTPTANPQTVAVSFNTAKALTLTASDPDSPALTLTYSVVTTPAHGTLSGTAPNLTYTPSAGYHGADSFTFTVNNGTNTSAPATVTLNVAAGTPTANPQTVNTNQDSPVGITLTGSDPDVPPLSLTYSVTTGPSHGTLSGTAPNLTYTPNAGFTGPDSFRFTVANGTNTSAAATVTIGVTAVPATVSGTVGVLWGTAGAATLQTNADGLRLLPAGRNTDVSWYGINKLSITLNRAATLSAADVSVTGVSLANYGPVTLSGSGTSYMITLAQPINAADRVTVTIGNAGIATFTRRLDVLPGDLNDDGGVTMQDAIGIRNQYLGIAGATPTIFGDVNGDSVVDVNDYNLARRLIGTVLP